VAEDAAEPATGSTQRLDPRSLRALAHPLRLQILAALRDAGPATASQLAAHFNESSGATSYHLRQLAQYGFVVEDHDRGTGRERWWKSVHRDTWLDRGLLSDPSPEVVGAMRSLLQDIAAQHSLDLGTWLEDMADWPAEWRNSYDLSDYLLDLTPELTRGLCSEIHEVIQRYRERPESEGSERVRFQLHAFPLPRSGVSAE
jgi:DNA-binding transcriptional ArsR family regulator